MHWGKHCYFNAGSLYKRFTPAGPDHAQVAAAAGMVDYVEILSAHRGSVGDVRARGQGMHDPMRAHETSMLQSLLDHVYAKGAMRLIGPPEVAR